MKSEKLINETEIKLAYENKFKLQKSWGRRGRDHMVVGFKLPMQSVPITTDVSSNLNQGKVYNIM
jgi:hypothetical protein